LNLVWGTITLAKVSVDVLNSSGKMPVTPYRFLPLLYNSLRVNYLKTRLCKLIAKFSLFTLGKHMGKCQYTYTVS